MATIYRYQLPVEQTGWTLQGETQTSFAWEYEDERAKLLALYDKGKKQQWDAATRIDWSLNLDPENPQEIDDRLIPIHGSSVWERLGKEEKIRIRRHQQAHTLSQFMHGEQGALMAAARIVQMVPDLDAKFYAATQVMDEARHVEAYARLLNEKLGIAYPITPGLQALLETVLTDRRWDMTYLGMQILIEGLALAAFQRIRDYARNRLAASVNAYVMQDEARHVAFGRLALRDYYPQLSQAERDEREEFVVEACYHMRDRFDQRELWDNLGLPIKECVETAMVSENMRLFRRRLFSRIVPTVKDIGLWGTRVKKAFADMGALEFAEVDADALLEQDNRVAQEFDAGQFVRQSLTPPA
ncbi:MAG TPA: ferritin-like domain-containing protein [Methylomirabilota bacterium]|nr:ferritin-like domain-containing protein [Methylomirabilota bacterium]